MLVPSALVHPSQTLQMKLQMQSVGLVQIPSLLWFQEQCAGGISLGSGNAGGQCCSSCCIHCSPSPELAIPPCSSAKPSIPPCSTGLLCRLLMHFITDHLCLGVSVYSGVFQGISVYSCVFQCIPVYSQCIPVYSSVSQCIPVYFSVFMNLPSAEPWVQVWESVLVTSVL